MGSSGYWIGEINAREAIRKMSELIDQFPRSLRAISEEELLYIPAPGKWSKKQVLGHLIDSGINNLKRFTETLFSSQPYVVQTYSQNELVDVNHYQELPLDHLVQLWQSINRQLIYVIRDLPEEKMSYKLLTGYTGEITLEWIICDYAGHMEHHYRLAGFA